MTDDRSGGGSIDLERGLRDARGVDAAGVEHDRVRAAAARGLFGEGAPAPRLGRFVVRRRLGAGAMGVVYEAEDPDLRRAVALKVVAPDWARSADARDRLIREARAMAALAHPNVVAVHEVGEAGADVFIAMELCSGGTLRSWIQSRPPWHEVLRALVAAGRGLEAAHARGLVHRDFKPDNVLFGADGRPRVADFGLAGVASAGSEAATHGAAPLSRGGTRAGAVLGTPGYMAPEQIQGRGADVRTDQFAFCSAYEALGFGRPFEAPSLDARLAAIAAGRRGTAERPGGIPARVRGVLERGTSFLPEHRFASMNELLAALERAARPSRVPWIVGAAAAAAVAGALVVTATSPPPKKKASAAGLDETSDEAAAPSRPRAPATAGSAAAARVAAIQALQASGELAACADAAAQPPADAGALAVGLACALSASDWDRGNRVCAAWRSLGDHPQSCEPGLLDVQRAMYAGDAEGCLRAARAQPPTPLMLGHRLSCAQAASRWDEYRAACAELEAKHKDLPAAKECADTVKGLP